MPLVEPAIKRCTTFFDGQNLYRSAKEAFGYHYPNYDALKLSTEICKAQNWNLTEVRFYTGVPDAHDDPFWNHFWVSKLAVMGRAGTKVYSRSLRYRNDTVKLPNGATHTFLRGDEKGTDVRIALDIIGGAMRDQFDVALVFSQDQDLSEVADEIPIIAHQNNRWIKIACAYPHSPTTQNKRGINKTQWIKIDRTTYDACIDPTDYRDRRINGLR